MNNYKGKLSKDLNPTGFNMVKPSGTTNIHKIFRVLFGSFVHITGYRGHSVSYAVFHLLTVVVFDEADDVLHTNPQ
jgi:hypothetical protein